MRPGDTRRASSEAAHAATDAWPGSLEPWLVRAVALGALRASGIEPRIVYTGTSYNGIRAAVASGLGMTVLARSTVPPELQIVEGDVALPGLDSAYLAIHRDEDNPDSDNELLIEYIRAVLRR